MYLRDRESKGTVTVYKDCYISYEVEERDEYVTVECPECGGDGEVWGYNHTTEDDYRIECPICRGTGDYETSIWIEAEDIEEYITTDAEVTPYEDDHLSYCGNSCTDYIERDQAEQLEEMMTRQFNIKMKEKERETEKEKNKILEKIKSLNFEKLEDLNVEQLERIANIMQQ